MHSTPERIAAMARSLNRAKMRAVMPSVACSTWAETDEKAAHSD